MTQHEQPIPKTWLNQEGRIDATIWFPVRPAPFSLLGSGDWLYIDKQRLTEVDYATKLKTYPRIHFALPLGTTCVTADSLHRCSNRFLINRSFMQGRALQTILVNILSDPACRHFGKVAERELFLLLCLLSTTGEPICLKRGSSPHVHFHLHLFKPVTYTSPISHRSFENLGMAMENRGRWIYDPQNKSMNYSYFDGLIPEVPGHKVQSKLAPQKSVTP